jgi:hypothetical protein
MGVVLVTTTVGEIREWFEAFKEQGYRYMIVMTDKFDYSDYPVAAKTAEFAREKLEEARKDDFRKAMEIYDLNGDMESQLNMRRAWCELK